MLIFQKIQFFDKNLFWHSLSFGLVGLTGFILNVVIARIMGPGFFGSLGSLLSLGAILLIVFDGGFKTLLYREASEVGSTQERDPSSYFWFASIYSLSMFALFLVALLFFFFYLSARPTAKCD